MPAVLETKNPKAIEIAKRILSKKGKLPKSFERTIKKEEKFILRESAEIKELKDDLKDIKTHIQLIKSGKNVEAEKHALDTYLKKAKKQEKWVSRIEYRLHQFRVKLDSEIGRIEEVILPESKYKLDMVKNAMDISEGNLLKIVSWRDGSLRQALDAVSFKDYEDPRLRSKENLALIEVEALVSQAEYFLNSLLSSIKILEGWQRYAAFTFEDKYRKVV